MFHMFLSIIFAPVSSVVLQTGTSIRLMTFARTSWIKNVSRDQISSVSHVMSREPENANDDVSPTKRPRKHVNAENDATDVDVFPVVNVDEEQITREHASRKFDVSTNPQLQVSKLRNVLKFNRFCLLSTIEKINGDTLRNEWPFVFTNIFRRSRARSCASSVSTSPRITRTPSSVVRNWTATNSRAPSV
jgi:hypothetical protein